jgi:hypothetical protein
MDPDTHSYFSWNFIKNEDNSDPQGLPISWEKARIDQTSAAIAPGHNTCTFNPLTEQSPTLDFTYYMDHNAPIIYSSATKEQKAWVYREPDQDPTKRPASENGEPGNKGPEDWLKHIFSRFATTYVDTAGKNHDVDVSITSAYTDNNLTIQISTITPELPIGIVNLPELLGSTDRFEKVVEQFKKQGFGVEVKPAYDVMDSEKVQRLLNGKGKATVLLLQGSKGGAAIVPFLADTTPMRKQSTMLILDHDGHPMISSRITLYGLNSK